MLVLAIITARGGSEGLSRKNVKLLAGKPLIAYTIEHALNAESINRVVVSTEDTEIAQIASKYGAEVPFPRSPDLARGDILVSSVMAETLRFLEATEGYQPDIVVLMTPVHPFRSDGIVDEVVGRLINNPDIDTCLLSAVTHRNYWVHNAEGYQCLTSEIKIAHRQARTPIYEEYHCCVSAYRPHVVFREGIWGDKVDIVVTDDPRDIIDIDDAFDFWMAEQIMSKQQPKSYPFPTELHLACGL